MMRGTAVAICSFAGVCGLGCAAQTDERALPAVEMTALEAPPAVADPVESEYEPGWRALPPLPADTPPPWHVSAAGGTVVAVGWGSMSVFDGAEWRRLDPVLPELDLGPGRRVVLADVMALAPDDVFAVGSRATIVHWDGSATRVEHQELGVTSRRVSRGRLEVCDGRVMAHMTAFTLAREPDGSWQRLTGSSATEARRCFTAVRLPKPSPQCGTYWWRPEHPIQRCPDGSYIWSERAQGWVHHSTLPLTDSDPLRIETADRLFIAFGDGQIEQTQPSRGDWERIPLPAAGEVRDLAATEEALFAVSAAGVVTMPLAR